MASDRPALDPTRLDAAARAVFERFTRRLIGLARSQLDSRLQLRVDPEDVVQSAYKSFFLRYGDDALLTADNESLWGLLTIITVRKCADRANYFHAERRNLAREAAGADELSRFVAGREPTPDEAVMLGETVETLLRDLDDDERPIIELSLQGYSTQEISDQLGRAERSVRRLRERVRLQLERLQRQ